MRQSYTFEDRHWVYFGYEVDWAPDRCKTCCDLLYRNLKPPPQAINCWKLEIFFSNCTDVQAVKDYLLEEGLKDHTLHGKWLKEEMEIPRDKLTSIPASAHPDPDVKKDGAILIYTQSIAERDERKAKILADLKARGLYRKDAISSRRGCVNFDEIIGPWTEWYDLERDYEGPKPQW
ncbi:MAG: hypothetical protein ACE5MB_10530 [Anaerolineae bacterium]